MKELTKKLLAVGLGAILAGSIVFGVLDRIYKNNLRDIEDTYNVYLSEVQLEREAEKERADSALAVVALYKAKNDSLTRIDRQRIAKVDHLEMELKQALNDMWDKYLEDNGLYAYDYLRGRYYSEDTLRYLFSGEQVTYMQTDIIKGDYLDSLLQLERDGTRVLEARILNYEGMVNTLEDENERLSAKNSELYDELEAWIRKQKLTEEEKEELKKKLRKWQVGGGSLAAVAALLLILL